MRRALLAFALVACAEVATPIAAPVAEQVTVAPICDAPPGEHEFYPPTGFESAVADGIRDEAETWNAVTREDYRIVFSSRGHRRVLAYKPNVPGFVGQCLPHLGVLLIDPNASDKREIALHEYGHELGLEHVPFRGAVMCGAPFADCGSTRATRITQADLDECVRVGACNP